MSTLAPSPLQGMQWARVRIGWGGLLGAAAASMAAGIFWGFTVDDALISARVASNLHNGVGYRFNAGGPVVDAVTPLGWAHLLMPFASSPLKALAFARWLGAITFVVAGMALGREMWRLGHNPGRLTPLLVMALGAPLGAWSVAGMETGLIIGLCTLAVMEHRFARAAVFCAVFARPELLPWALTFQVGRALSERRAGGRVLFEAMIPWLALLAAASLRLICFGQAAPLSLTAKPGDWSQGVSYVWGALIWSGPPLLLVAWRPWQILPPRMRAMAVAAAVHAVSMAAIGGDWMPFFRLMAPILPSLLLVASAIAERSGAWQNSMRLLLSGSLCAVALTTRAPVARAVSDQRTALMTQLGQLLTANDRVMTLDVGWVGASAPVSVIDLAGVTDPAVARLTGGHTSKRLPPDFFEATQPTVVVLLEAPDQQVAEPWYDARFDRVVEQRVALQAQALERRARHVTRLPQRGTPKHYVVARFEAVR